MTLHAHTGAVFSGFAPNGSTLMNLTAFDAAMEVATAVFPGVAVNTYGGLSVVGTTTGADMTAAAKAIAAHLKNKGWPKVYEAVGDEPAGPNIDASDALAVAIENAGVS